MTNTTQHDSWWVGQKETLGPRVPEFFHDCLDGESKILFTASLIIGAVSMVLVWPLYVHHRAKFEGRALSLLRMHYRHMIIFPVAWNLGAVMIIVCPRSALIAELISGTSEAFALYTFMALLLMIVSWESLQNHDSEVQLPQGIDHVLSSLNAAGEKTHFAVPPCFCCCTKVFPRHKLTARHLSCMVLMVRQYLILEFGVSIFNMWAVTTLPIHMGHRSSWLCKVVLKVSGIIAVYALFVLYWATRDLLHAWGTTLKFFSIKFMIVISLLQQRLVAWLCEKFWHKDGSCLIDPAEPENLKFVIQHWCAVLIALESVFMMMLFRNAFPPSEVKDEHLHHFDILHMALRQGQEDADKENDVETSDASSEFD